VLSLLTLEPGEMDEATVKTTLGLLLETAPKTFVARVLATKPPLTPNRLEMLREFVDTSEVGSPSVVSDVPETATRVKAEIGVDTAWGEDVGEASAIKLERDDSDSIPALVQVETRLECILVRGQFVADVLVFGSHCFEVALPLSLDFVACAEVSRRLRDHLQKSTAFVIVARDDVGRTPLRELARHLGENVAAATPSSRGPVLLQAEGTQLKLIVSNE